MLSSVGSWITSVRIPPELKASPFSRAVVCPAEQPRQVRATRVAASRPLTGSIEVLLWALSNVTFLDAYATNIAPRELACLFKSANLDGKLWDL